MAIAVRLLVSAVNVLPGSQVDAAVQLPSLDWFEVGHTFEYRMYNDTFEWTFNATIKQIDGNQMLFDFWDVNDGTPETVHTRGRNKSRENLNFTDAYTFMWVNETNVDTESAIIGRGSYDLNLLESTDTTLVFENENRTLEYNATKGWLELAVFHELDITWELRAARDAEAPANVDVDNPIYCDERTRRGKGDWDNVKVETAESWPLGVLPQMCWDEGLTTTCYPKAVMVSRVEWVGWLYQGSFTWAHQTNLGTGFSDSGSFLLHLDLVNARPLRGQVINELELGDWVDDGHSADVESYGYSSGNQVGQAVSWTCTK